jgi:hypothetical protein
MEYLEVPSIQNSLHKLGITKWKLVGSDPTNEAEFNSSFFKEMSVNNCTAVYSSDPSDFGVTWAEVKTAQDTLKAEWDAQEYARSRKVEYDLLNQFELMTDDAINDTTTHLDAINAIKAKYPKP